jgi:diguanylate cyclase (GGDEF)-like protein/PAS domain S-box-containing protein
MTKNVLLVEDNPVNIEYIKALINNISADNSVINESAYKLTSFVTLKDTTDFLSSHSVDIILLDLTLPDSRGIHTFTSILSVNDRIPIIILTGDEDTKIALDAIKYGAQDYLVKGKINKALLDRSMNYAIQRMNILKALLESEERYSIALKATNDGIWEWNLRDQRLYYSPRWKEIIGFNEDEISNNPSEWFDRIHPDDVLNVESAIAGHLSGETSSLVSEHRLLHKNGIYIWVRIHGLAVLGKSGSVKKIAGSLTDITGEKFIDSLTGLPTMSLFSDRLQSHIQRIHDEKKFGFVLIKIQFEQTKIVTNTYGAGATDIVLQNVIARIKAVLKPSDTIGRLEGATFGIILSGVQDFFDLNHILDNIQTLSSKPIVINDNHISISSSIGVLFSGKQYKKAEEMLRDVDSALEKALLSGRSGREVFESAMRERSLEVLHLEAEMRRALERDEFFLVYQPIINLKKGKVETLEALIRWRKQDGTIISPSQFIPIAEESDMIIRIGAWVVEESILKFQQMEKMGILDTTISINFSSRQFLNWNMVNYLKRTLSLSGTNSSAIEIEITESVAMKDLELSKKILHNLKSTGIKISLDDFGTGYSSLSYLKEFPIDKLKLDQSFVKGIPDDKENSAIVSALIALGHALDLEVVIEGVETAEQYDFISMQNVDMIQGYYLSRPIEAGEVEKFIIDYNKNFLLKK